MVLRASPCLGTARCRAGAAAARGFAARGAAAAPLQRAAQGSPRAAGAAWLQAFDDARAPGESKFAMGGVHGHRG